MTICSGCLDTHVSRSILRSLAYSRASLFVRRKMIRTSAYRRWKSKHGPKNRCNDKRGHCPGLNAAIRAIVRCAGRGGAEVIGIRNGWQGPIELDTVPLTAPKGVRNSSPVLERSDNHGNRIIRKQKNAESVRQLANSFRVKTDCGRLFPWLSLRSNPGLN